MGELTGFIPAGGLGSRLRPHTLEVPKPLLLMGAPDRRVIDGPLEVSTEACAQTWVTTDYLAEQLHEYVEGRPGVTAVRDTETVGSGGSLLSHLDEFSDVELDGDMLILPSDHIYEGFSAVDFWEHHKFMDADITLLTVPPKSYGEYVSVDGSDVTAIKKAAGPEDLSTTGIFIVRNKYLMDWLFAARRFDDDYRECNIYHDIICPAVGRASVVRYLLSSADGYWEDTGTPERYLGANMRLSKGENVISPEAYVDASVRLEGCVVLGESVLSGAVALKNAIISARKGVTEITTAEKIAA